MVRASLRVRTMAAFGLVSLVLSGTLAIFAYSMVRASLIEERRESAMREAYTNARAVRTRLRTDDSNLTNLLAGLQINSANDVLLRRDGQWYTGSLDTESATLPASLRAGVEEGRAGNQIIATNTGTALAVGVPIPEAKASYYQVISLDDIDQALGVLGSSLALGALIAAAAGVLTGAVVSRRVIRPLRDISGVAREIATGEADTRLDPGNDPDLRPLAESFNAMVDELEARAQREERFASDISHDLRGPLTALAAAVNVVNRRRDQLPPEAAEAVDALDEQVTSFNQLVLDLLEISRFEAGTAVLQTREVDVLGLVRAIVDEREDCNITIRLLSEDPGRAVVDPRRIQQVFTNLLDNADNYGGGAETMAIVRRSGSSTVQISVEDHGPGVAEDERSAIFERFHRGKQGTAPGSPRGTGLGLPLAAEHVRLHGGRIWVEDADPSGARFVVELPAVMPDAKPTKGTST